MKRGNCNLRPRFKLWLSTDNTEGVFGDGKWRLLKAIVQNGSLKAAAESLGISYRKAWGDIKKAEKCLGTTLIEKHHGGRTGGSTHLTSTGRKWLRAYSLFRSKVDKTVNKAHSTYIKGMVDGNVVE